MCGRAVASLAALSPMGQGVRMRRGPGLAAGMSTVYGLELTGDLYKVTEITAPTVCASSSSVGTISSLGSIFLPCPRRGCLQTHARRLLALFGEATGYDM